MKLLSVVRLVEDFSDVPAGTRGTIVFEHDDTHFEVEFMDELGKTIAVVSVPANLLELIENV